MTKGKGHIDKNRTDRVINDLAGRMDIPFKISKEDAWDTILSNTSGVQGHENTLQRKSTPNWIAIAASLAMIISLSAFILLFQKTSFAEYSDLATHLPGGSMVLVEEGSQITWSPISWKLNRKVKLQGTAYFDVVKGKRFTVVSGKATTEVLGTTFRIEAKKDTYKVSCFTGKVKVTDRQSSTSAILLANERAVINEKGEFAVTIIKEEQSTKKPENLFFTFRNERISKVFADLEAHFNIEIVTSESLDLFFSGNLKVGSSFEEILSAICLPLDLEYEKVSDNKYLVKPAKNF